MNGRPIKPLLAQYCSVGKRLLQNPRARMVLWCGACVYALGVLVRLSALRWSNVSCDLSIGVYPHCACACTVRYLVRRWRYTVRLRAGSLYCAVLYKPSAVMGLYLFGVLGFML